MHRHESMSRCKFDATSIEAQVLQPWVVHILPSVVAKKPASTPKFENSAYVRYEH